MLYAIGDVHLSLSSEKPMDIFGGNWDGYVEKLRAGLSVLRAEDTCVFCGDTSWGMRLGDALEDFRFLDAFPGRKILLKGNHDYWWETSGKMNRFFAENGIQTFNILHNNFYEYDGIAICGTRGWFFEEDKGTEQDRKIFLRELGRLEASLIAAGELTKYVFLHYPPIFNNYLCYEILDLFSKYGVSRCYYGHIHGSGHHYAFEGVRSCVTYTMVSADWLNFNPVCIV
ncbi:MAG: metallophosphoesterase [Oscillospiraceae bacterium]|jgi:predicted phosphohydrolase|nr:metallophosphoesterase [Oscillospiraceae bacterium]